MRTISCALCFGRLPENVIVNCAIRSVDLVPLTTCSVTMNTLPAVSVMCWLTGILQISIRKG